MMFRYVYGVFFSSRRRHTRCALVTGVQTCALPISSLLAGKDNNIGLLIKQVQSSLNRMIDQHVSPLGLTAMQWRPLVMIRYLDINTPAELSRGAHVEIGRASCRERVCQYV